MIVKPSFKAEECAAIAAFIASPDFARLPERARKEVISRQRGLNGERTTAHILDREFYNAPDHALLHDLRVPDGIGGFAQIDHLILSRLSRTAAIIEVKNYRGRLSKNDHNEWHVWYEGRRRPIDIPNPLAQARRQREVLRAWLRAHRHEVAFETVGAFVIIPPDCSIDRSKVGGDERIYKADNFVAEWMEFGGITPLGRLFSTGVSAKTMVSIASQLVGYHQPDPRGLNEISRLLTDKAESAVDSLSDEKGEDEIGSAATAPADEGAPADASAPAIVVDAVAIPPVSEAEPTLHDTVVIAPEVTAADRWADAASGIHERELPNGQIAFSSSKDDQDAKDRLKEACDGRAKWNSRYQRWLCSDDRALEIKQILAGQLQHRSVTPDRLIAEGSSDHVLVSTKPSDLSDPPTGAARTKKPLRKAGEIVELSPGISKRALPDGRVAFLAAKDDAAAIERVRNACRGRGQWKPLFGNWVCDGDAALLVEQAIAHAQVSITPTSGVGDLPTQADIRGE